MALALLRRGGQAACQYARTFTTEAPSAIGKMMEHVRLENEVAKGARPGSIFYNFMPGASRTIQAMEREHGPRCVTSITETLIDPNFDGPAARFLLNALTRMIPTRQSRFEAVLSTVFPGWRTYLTQTSPQDSYPSAFGTAANAVKDTAYNAPKHIIDCIGKCLHSNHQDVVLEALKAAQRIGDAELIPFVQELLKGDDPTIRHMAILTLARLSSLKSQTYDDMQNIVRSDAPTDERLMAAESLLETTPTSGRNEDLEKSMVDEKLTDLVCTEEFMCNVLDTPRRDIKDATASLLERTLSPNDDASSSLTLRMARAHNIPGTYSLDASRRLLLEREVAALAQSRFGLLVQRDGKVWVGHTGIFVSEDRVIDVNTGRDPKACREISFSDWKNGETCWGAREDANHPVDLHKAVARAREIASWRTEYDGAHNNQKGKWFKGWWCGPRYWEADCVGFTEHVYEHAGGNPTPRSYEVGAGWPLTPREQRDHMRKVFDC